MQLICAADLHGWMPPISVLSQKPDALLLLGDLEWAVRSIVEVFPGVPVLGVPGNHDDPLDPFCGVTVENLHGKVVEIKGMRVGGLGGCLRYRPGSGFLYWEREYAEILRRMPAADIFISHCPPACLPWCDSPQGEGFWHEPHEGSAALAEYLFRTEPAVFLCGHLHTCGEMKFGSTLVCAVYGVGLLELVPAGPEAGGQKIKGEFRPFLREPVLW